MDFDLQSGANHFMNQIAWENLARKDVGEFMRDTEGAEENGRRMLLTLELFSMGLGQVDDELTVAFLFTGFSLPNL